MSETDDAPDLSTVTSEQLIDELVSRAASVVIGFDPAADKDGTYYARRAGSVLGCAGLVRRLELLVDDDLEEMTVEEDEDDE